MNTKQTIFFACRRVRSGEIDLHALAVAYLAACTAATGRPLEGALSDGSSIDEDARNRVRFQRTATGQLRPATPPLKPLNFPPIPLPRRETEYETDPYADWSEPFNTRETLNWNSAAVSLCASKMSSRLQMFSWTATGLPDGCRFVGFSYLRFDKRGEAWLELQGPEQWIQKVHAAFRDALHPFDILNDSEGAASLALETALSQRVVDDPTEAWTAEEVAAAEMAIPDSDPTQTAGMALRFFVAVGHLALGNRVRADELLKVLETSGKKIVFSHGINVFYRDGKPLTVGWQDDFPPPHPWHEVRLARAVLNLAEAKREAAVEELRKLSRVKGFTAHREAKNLLEMVG